MPEKPKRVVVGIEADIRYSYISDNNWAGLGTYIAQQYIRYYNAIKAADPTARIFGPALEYLPRPTLPVIFPRAIPIWEAFLNELYRVDPNKPWLDGIALHAYPNHHSTYHTSFDGITCTGVDGNIPDWFLDAPCVEQALRDGYRYLQDTNTSGPGNPHPELTGGRPIWITETGVLYDTLSHPNWRNELPWSRTRDYYQQPLLTWFRTAAAPLGQPPQEPSADCCMWFNSLTWFVSHWNWYEATSLLDAPNGNLNALGVNWCDATCLGCSAPGYDAP